MNAPAEVPPAPRSSHRLAWLVLGCLAMAFTAFVLQSSQQLPDRVATHFAASGKADGWMPRVQYRNFTLGIGLGAPLFVLGTFAVIRALKGFGLNMPNKKYWLEPERRDATYAFIQRQGIWLAVLLILLHGVLFHLITLANSAKPAVLPPAQAFGATGVFLVAVAVWALVFVRRFRLPKA